MNIKYLYQLLISHMTPILVAFLILSFSFSQFIENLVYENKVEELMTYGEQIGSLSNERMPRGNTMTRVRSYSDLLKARNIHFLFFNEEGKVNFHPAKLPPDLKLSEEEWETIKRGEKLVVKRDLDRFDQVVSLVAIPLIKDGTFQGGIMLTSAISGSERMISEINKSLFTIMMFTVFITVLISWFLSSFHVRRIRKLRDGTSKVALGDYDVTVPVTYRDEVGELSRDFNEMVKKLKESDEEIERLEKLRRQFMADVSHELRTPLTTIKGIIEGMRTDILSGKEKQKGIDLMHSETKRLIRLVNENLDYERIRTNQVQLHKVRVSLVELFETINDHLAPFAKEKGNRIEIEAEEGITLFADYDRVIQILMNLTKNSIQFTENGTIYLKGQRGYNETVIMIEDDGIGMDPEEIHSIWERFYKADVSRRSLPHGEFGLGLSIVKKLIEIHDGTIEVKSKKQQGTVFTLRFPHEQTT
ncbi:sensor histidine kinase [Rossellomorea aquimaris]|uniref:sensor histidine kinase n=1 Tax=Rossellomorea aquimaris TaxID=189382 RepID=UPI0021E59626|nr:HAMP domain-containing sensor histidine kinase [Rossellomorea aquimaris]